MKAVGQAYQLGREKIENEHNYEWRELIAMPIIVKDKNRVNPLNRHAKPYFLHIEKVNGKYLSKILLLPQKYIDQLPDKKFAAFNIEKNEIENLRLDYLESLNLMEKYLITRLKIKKID
jgi:hypothetical protein